MTTKSKPLYEPFRIKQAKSVSIQVESLFLGVLLGVILSCSLFLWWL
jgi:hypothetical protein